MTLLGAALACAVGGWLYALVAKGTSATLFATVPLVAAVLAIRIVHDRFCRNGYYGKKQAIAFYTACKANGISRIRSSPIADCDRIYREQVADVDLGAEKKRLTVYEQIFNEGKNLSKKEKDRNAS